MKTLLIVDDEKIIRKGLNVMIKRFGCSFDNIYEAKNGKEALEIINTQNVDAVLTDILMPIMNGIDLIKNISLLQKKPQIIILSGHDDFSYAKEAIKCGVRGYLLKPVDREELFKTIRSLESDIDNNIINNTEIEKINVLKTVFKDIQEDLLNYMFINQQADEYKMKNKISALGVKIFESDFFISIIIRNNDSKDLDDMNILFETISSYFISEKAICLQGPEKKLILISKSKPEIELINNLNEISETKFVLGVSNYGSNIHEQYYQANIACDYRILKDKSIISYDEVKDIKSSFSVNHNNIKKIANMINANRGDEANTLLAELFEHKDYPIAYYVKTASELFELVNESIPLVMKELLLDFKIMKNIYSFSSIFEYVEQMKIFFTHIAKCITATPDEIESICAIEKSIRYMKSNYQKDIDLAVVSNYVSLNYYYFSQLFKSRVGENFTEYLKKLRIEKSKELLSKTDDKIYKIAEEVGFTNPKHFMKSFRKETGVSPKEYRKLF